MDLFEVRPIKLDGFTLHARGVAPVGRPSIEQWKTAMNFAMATEQASPFWVGALWNYAEGRTDWQAKLQQALGELGRPLSLKSFQNLGSIDKHVSPMAKQLAPSVAHASEVQALDPVEQAQWMEKAKTEEMTVRDLRLEIRASRRRRVIEGQAVLEGLFRVVYADPPFAYGDRPPSGSGAAQHYNTMSMEAIAALPVAAHCHRQAVLFLWVPVPLTFANPGPREIIDAWGFEPKTGMVWDKVLHGFGHYVEVRHENLWICTRGSCLPDRVTPMISSVITERRSLQHSEKPESARKIIERLYDGPRLELFARRQSEGWTAFGNDARLWSAPADDGAALPVSAAP